MTIWRDARTGLLSISRSGQGNALRMPHSSLSSNLRTLLVIAAVALLSGCGFTRSSPQWIIVINRTIAPHAPVLIQSCDVSMTDTSFRVTFKIPDDSTTAAITGTFRVAWRDPKHEDAFVKAIGVSNNTASGTGNITRFDGDGEPLEFLIKIRSNVDQEIKDYVIAIKRFD
jgi:hypothetical protein